MSIPQGRDGSFNPTSPHSSTGLADSFKGTPDTRLTAFSPEDGSTKSLRAPHSVGASGRHSGPVKFKVGTPASLNLPRRQPLLPLDPTTDRDPFTSSGVPSSQVGRKLSPTASCFSPLVEAGVASGSSQTNANLVKTKSEEGPETSSGRQLSVASSVPGAFVHHELSTELGISRCVIVATTIRGSKIHPIDVEQYISTLNQRGFHFHGSKQLYPFGDQVYVRFNNIRDACLFSHNAGLGGQGWLINYIRPRDFTQVVDPSSTMVTEHEGQLTLAVFSMLAQQTVDPSQVQPLVQNILSAHGDLFAFKIQPNGVSGCIMYALVEYCDNDVSLRAVAELGAKVIEGYQIYLSLYRPDVSSAITPVPHGRIVSPARAVNTTDFTSDFQALAIVTPSSTVASTPNGMFSTPTRPTNVLGYQNQTSYGMMPMVYNGMPLGPAYMIDQVSPRPQSMVPTGNYSWASGPMYPRQPSMMSPAFMTPRQFSYPRDGRRQNAVRVHRSPFHNHNVSGQHNQVDVNRIREGIDVRTTIMLRNIPNKVDQAMLKRIVDDSSWGKYDFMYLRIDFANDCNVGYAFINFVDPLDIIDFVNKRGNQRWNCFKSDKVAEISYATIQGKDCLVQKFRNSSVMLEAPHYRPKLYFTINGPRPDHAGHEEPFPEPDNQSKMKRSCENAEHVGLFTPNAGQHFRDEQRRRRSQYDRGTRLAAMEEFDFDPTFQPHQSLYHPQ